MLYGDTIYAQQNQELNSFACLQFNYLNVGATHRAAHCVRCGYSFRNFSTREHTLQIQIYVCTCDRYVYRMYVISMYLSTLAICLCMQLIFQLLCLTFVLSSEKQTKCNKQSELISQFCFNNNLEKCKRIFINQLIQIAL